MRREVKSKIVFSRVILRDRVYGNCRVPEAACREEPSLSKSSRLGSPRGSPKALRGIFPL